MYTIPIQIRFNDVDIFGHVNNSVYNQYLDLGRVGYFQSVLEEATQWHGKTIVLVRIENNYLLPTFLHDKIEVRTNVYEMGNRSVKMHQQVVDENGQIRLESYSVLSTFDSDTNASFLLPDEWRKKIEEHENQK